MLMNLNNAMRTVTSSGTMPYGAFALAIACAVASPAAAAPTRVQARQDQTVESSFALDFGLGGVASAQISDTEFELEIDGLTGSARFVSYDQDIDPLFLPTPFGPVSTGAIRVQIVPNSSTGTYNRLTGAFATSELYNIEFEGDLSAFGLVSPVVLPSQSVGVVDLESSTVGRVTMNWAGSNLSNPTVPLDFSYICTLFATFTVTAASYVEIEMVPLVSITAMSESLRSTLEGYLNSAIVALNTGNVRGGVGSLRTFILKTRNAVSGSITQPNALVLVNAANTAINLALNPIDQVQNRPVVTTDKGTTRISE